MGQEMTDTIVANATDKSFSIVHNGHSAQEHADALHIGHESTHSLMFFILIGFMIGAQFGLHWWKRKYFQSYQNITLLGVWGVPFVLSCMMGFWRMLAVWFVFSAFTGWLMHQSTRKPLHQRTPRRVYRWFNIMYKTSYVCGMLGYILVMLEFSGATHALSDSHSLAAMGTMLLFYGLYYGVLTRDFAEMCTGRMASTMGIISKNGLPSKVSNPLVCGICNNSLPGEHEEGAEQVYSLNCKHRFHEFCIRGWTIIGKKDTCPFCNEKVSLRATLKAPWESQSILWANLLDALRYLIVWNPVILFAVQAVYYIFDLK